MSEPIFGITAEQAIRIGQAVQTVDRLPAPVLSKTDRRRDVERDFWARLGEEDPDNAGRYKWKRVDPVEGSDTLAELPAGVATTAGDAFTAKEVNGTADLTDKYVRLRFSGMVANKPVFHFTSGKGGEGGSAKRFKITTAGAGGASGAGKPWDGTTLGDDAVTILFVQGHAAGDIVYAVESENGTSVAGASWVEILHLPVTTEVYKVLQIVDATGHVGFDYVRAH